MKTILTNVWAYLKASYVRFNTESPIYWKRIQSALTWLATATASLSDAGQTLIIQVTGYGLNVPEGLKEVAGYVATAAFFARLIAGLAIEKSAVSETKFEKLSNPTDK